MILLLTINVAKQILSLRIRQSALDGFFKSRGDSPEEMKEKEDYRCVVQVMDKRLQELGHNVDLDKRLEWQASIMEKIHQMKELILQHQKTANEFAKKKSALKEQVVLLENMKNKLEVGNEGDKNEIAELKRLVQVHRGHLRSFMSFNDTI